MPKEFTQANINLTKDDANMVDHMMRLDGYVVRSAFVRKLIRQEWARRHPTNEDATPSPTTEELTNLVAKIMPTSEL